MGLEQGLQAIGEGFLKALITTDGLAFYRLVVAECRKYPAFMQAYLLSAADRIRSIVVKHLRKTAPEIEDPDHIAGYFLEMVRSRHLYRALADERYLLSDKEISDHVARVVQFLVAGARQQS